MRQYGMWWHLCRAVRHPSWILWSPNRGEPGFEHCTWDSRCFHYRNEVGDRGTVRVPSGPIEQFCLNPRHRSRLHGRLVGTRALIKRGNRALKQVEALAVVLTLVLVLATYCAGDEPSAQLDGLAR